MRYKLWPAISGVLLATPALWAAVPVEQIEAPETGTSTGYAPTDFNGAATRTAQPGDFGGGLDFVTFHANTSLPTTATYLDHAKFVGLYFYGTGTLAHQYVTDVYCDSAYYFFDNVVQTRAATGTATAPGTFLGGSKIINNSYVLTYGAGNFTADQDAARRVDYMINAADVTLVGAAVSSVGDGNYYDLVWSSYNCLSVSGSQAFSPSSTPGKTHADLYVANEASFGTATVSGYAASLYGIAQAAGQTDALHGVVLRSLLMTGADKGASVYTRQTANNLDIVRGAGQANFNTSLVVLQGGEKAVAAANITSGAIVSSAGTAGTQYGWAEATLTVNGQQVLLIHADNAITGLVATLNWNVTSNSSSGNINTASPVFAKLALELRTVTGAAGSYVLGAAQTNATLKSAVTGDNVQHLYSTGTLSAGNYALLVTGDTTLSALYGLSYSLSGSFASRWNISAGGSWGTPSNWSNGIPNGPAAQANFLSSPGITTPSTITLDGDRQLGQITFSNPNSYTITPGTGGTLTVNDAGDSTGTNNPLFTVSTGSHTVSAPIALSNGLTVSAAAATSLNLSAGLTGTGPLTKTGTGGLTLGGSNAYGNTNVSAGTLTVDPTGAITTGTVTVGSSAFLRFAAGTSLLQRNAATPITVNAGGTVTLAPPTSSSTRQLLITTGGLTLAGTTSAWTAKLDLTGNDLDIPGGNLSTITNQIKAGFNLPGGGLWTGNGITSSAAGSDTSHVTAVGVIANTAGLYGAANPFDGYAAATTDILIRYTYFGDANLDGKVDGSDYSRIDSGFITHTTGWSNGDFNYDGVIDGSDYSLIDNAFSRQKSTLSPNALIAVAAPAAAVPEPAAIGGFLAMAISVRRQRRFAVPRQVAPHNAEV